MDKTPHVIFTRFNLSIVLGGQKSTKIHDTDWLTFRFDLFRRFCYPSIAQQECQDFLWFVLFDAETPEWAFELMAKEFPRATVIKTEDFSSEARTRWIDEHCPPSTMLITSRLDSDDCLHREYTERVRKAIKGIDRGVLNFLYGFTMRGGRFYKIAYKCNAFTSYYEPRSECKTIFAEQHQNLEKLDKVHNIIAPPMWLQVIHGTNVGNDLYGVITPNVEHHDFGIVPDDTWGKTTVAKLYKEVIICWLRNFSRQTGIGRKVRSVLGRGS